MISLSSKTVLLDFAIESNIQNSMVKLFRRFKLIREKGPNLFLWILSRERPMLMILSHLTILLFTSYKEISLLTVSRIFSLIINTFVLLEIGISIFLEKINSIFVVFAKSSFITSSHAIDFILSQ